MRLLAAAICLPLTALAAEPVAIARIRAKYQSLLERAQQEPDLRHVVVSRRIVPGIGEQTKTMEFFTSETDDEEPKTGAPRTRRTLERVVLSWNIGPRPMKTDLLFLDGALAFAHLIDTSGACQGGETRLYFEKAALLRARTSPEPDCSTPAGTQRDATFTKADKDLARAVQAEALERLAWWTRLEAL